MFYYYGFGFIIVGMLISIIASLNVKATFAKYSKVQSRERTSAREVAESILRNSEASDVSV